MHAQKKLVVKLFKEKPKLPENFEEDTWAKLRAAIQAVLERHPLSYSEEELYRAVENLCLHKLHEKVYSRLEAECDSHIAKNMRRLVNQTCESESFLSLVDGTWKEHCQAMSTIRNLFLYLDRTYVLRSSHVKSIWDLGLDIFSRHIQTIGDVEGKTARAVLDLIHKERCGHATQRYLLKGVLQMLCSLKRYEIVFERQLLTSSRRFYLEEGEKLISQMSLADYLAHVEKRIEEEEDRLHIYLSSTTRRPLLDTTRSELLAKHTTTLLEKEFPALVDENRISDLERLYRLFSQVGAIGRICSAWGVVLKSLGGLVMRNEGTELVEALLEYKKKCDRVLSVAFMGNEDCAQTLKESFQHFLNINPNLPAQALARYVDEILRTSYKGKNYSASDDLLSRVLVLFRFLAAKDVFEAFYKKGLARRLLLGRSSSTDAEKAMIQRLKDECGHGFTGKMEGMFKDVELSRDVLTSFLAREDAQEAVTEERLEFSCHVLTSGVWPNYPTCSEMVYPPAATRLQEAFKAFYRTRHTGRSLTWITSLGTCSLRANFSIGNPSESPEDASDGRKAKRHEVVVSHAQAVVLLLYNRQPSLTYCDILNASGIPEAELKRTLQSLSLHKVVKLLLKQSPGREVGTDDRFDFNFNFSSKLYRVVVNQIQAKETREEAQATEDKVHEDRQYQLDAAIVRIMKVRKVLLHNLLLAELFSQISFPCKAPDVKKRLESLIEREYLERDPNNPNLYNYLA